MFRKGKRQRGGRGGLREGRVRGRIKREEVFPETK